MGRSSGNVFVELKGRWVQEHQYYNNFSRHQQVCVKMTFRHGLPQPSSGLLQIQEYSLTSNFLNFLEKRGVIGGCVGCRCKNKVARITTSSTLTAKNSPVEILAKTKQTKYCKNKNDSTR